MVTNADALIICQVCVAKCAAIFDEEVGRDPPSTPWADRWPLKS